MKKKLLFLLPAVAMVLAGCGGNPDTPTTDDPTTSGDVPTSTPAPTSTPTPTSSTPYTPTHAGTEADPLNAVDAYNIASELAESGSQEKFPTATKYFVKDVVTSVTECSVEYGNATFSFGEPATPFTGYRLKVGESKQAITSADQIEVDDIVTIYSDLINFHGTMETNDGYIVSIEKGHPKILDHIAVSGQKTEYIVGDSLVKPTVTAYYTDETSETVDDAEFTGFDSSAAATGQVITVTYGGKTTTYTINIIADTLVSIAVSGDMTNKKYAVGSQWNPAGLVATGTYSISGEVDVTAQVSWGYTPAAPAIGITSVDVVATLGAIDSAAKSVSGITVISSMQYAYEAVAALNKGASTSDQYTFEGVVTGFYGNSFNVQDGAYGMYVYTSKAVSGVAVGKNVRVTAILKNYSNMFETTGTPTVTVLGDGVLPTPVAINSAATLSATNQNVLANLTGATFKSESTAWSSSANGLYTFKLGGVDEVTIKFDKYSYDAAKLAIFSGASEGDAFDFSNVAVTKYNDNLQIQFGKTSTIAVHA